MKKVGIEWEEAVEVVVGERLRAKRSSQEQHQSFVGLKNCVAEHQLMPTAVCAVACMCGVCVCGV